MVRKTIYSYLKFNFGPEDMTERSIEQGKEGVIILAFCFNADKIEVPPSELKTLAE